MISSVQGDLNGDHQADRVIVLQQEDPSKLRENNSFGPPLLNLNTRRLLILLKGPGGYKAVFERDDLLPSEHNEVNRCLEDPLMESGGIFIANRNLVVNLSYWQSCGSYETTQQQFVFRFEDNRFRLIGYDYSSFSRSTHDSSEQSFNYLTGKQKVAREEGETARVHEAWSRFPNKHKFYLDEITFECATRRDERCG